MRAPTQQMRPPLPHKRTPKAEVIYVVFRSAAILAAVLTIVIVPTLLSQIPGEKQRNSATAKSTGNNAQLGTSGSSLFLPVVTHNSGGNYSYAVAVADLNGDGIPDVVVGNAGSHTVTVLLGDGHGGLGPPKAYFISATGDPNSVAVGDLNGDGKPDIVVANYAFQDCGVAVLLGNGDGTLQAPVMYGSSAVCAASSVVITDLNGDGKLDLAVATYRKIAILLGNGDGTFQPAVTFNWGNGDGTSWGANALAVGDVNGDGKPDLIVASGYQVYWNSGKGAVGVLLGNGDGSFQPAVDYDSGGDYAWSLAMADVNGDSKVDIVVANNCTGGLCAETVGVLLGKGDGTFQSAVSYNAGASPYSVGIRDVNGDGTPDLVVSYYCVDSACSVSAVGVLIGKGDGTFQSPLMLDSGGDFSLSLAIGDLNDDGKPDLVVANATCYGVDCGHGSIGVLLNNSRTFTKTTLTSSLNPSFIGQAVTFTANITSAAGSPPNGETISFYQGSVVLGTAALSGGVASLTIASLPVGSFAMTASYSGDAHFAASTSSALRQVVNPTNKYASSIGLVSSRNPSIYGQKVTWTATVTSSGSITPTGTVRFKWSGYLIGSATLNGGGVATLTKSNLNADSYPLTAIYVGDSANLGSTSPVVNQSVTPTTSTATLTSAPNPSAQGQAVTFTAKISSPTVIPTGPVTFTAGTTVLGTAQLSGGKATLTVSSLAAGSTRIRVTYYGDSNIAKSSASVTQLVQ